MVAALKSHSVQSGNRPGQIPEASYTEELTVARPQPSQKVAFLRSARRSRMRLAVVPDQSLSTVSALPKPQPRPLWLRLLLRCQQGTTVMAGTLMVSALALYSSTVSLNSQVGQGTQRLATLQRDRQQLTTANEVLKNHMAEQAEAPGAGLHTPHPDGMLFLNSSAPSAESPRQQAVPVAPTNAVPHSWGQRPFVQPLGY